MVQNEMQKNLSNQTITLKKPVKINFHDSQEEGLATKKEKFESFLTHRRRLTRLALSQALYFYEQFSLFNEIKLDTIEEEMNEIYRVIIYFYKKMFFRDRYGDNKKNKKLEEKFIKQKLFYFLKNKQQIDKILINNIKKPWCLNKINFVIKATARACISEALSAKEFNFKIFASEYTGIVSQSASEEKEIAFFNGLIENCLKEIKNIRNEN